MDAYINDPRIDREHDEIMQLFESYGAVRDSATAEDLRRLLAKIKEHVVVHFVDEEFIFERQYEMPDDYVAMHKQDHERIRRLVLTKTNSASTDGTEGVARSIDEIRTAIVDHIRDVDAKMNEYLPEQAAR